MFTALIYPQNQVGQPYARPPIPETFLRQVAHSKTWDVHSPDPADRTEWWEDTAGELTQADLDEARG